MNQRVEWIDNLKGFVLFMVCLGHIQFPTVFPYMFGINQMQTFFFVSGMLFPITLPPFRLYMQRKFRTLMVPYLFFSFSLLWVNPDLLNPKCHYGIAHLFISRFPIPDRFQRFIVYTYSTLTDVINGAGNTGVGTVWFFYVLFFSCTIFYLMIYLTHKCSKNRVAQIAVLTVLMMICCSIGWSRNIEGSGTAFKVGAVMSSILFIWAGYISKPLIEKIGKCNRFCVAVLLTLTYCICFYLYREGFSPTFGVNKLGSNFYGYVAEAITGVYFLVISAIKSERILHGTVLSTFFKFMSRNAIVILPIHWFVWNWYRFVLQEYDTEWWYMLCAVIVVTIGTIAGLYVCKRWAWRFVGIDASRKWYQ